MSAEKSGSVAPGLVALVLLVGPGGAYAHQCGAAGAVGAPDIPPPERLEAEGTRIADIDIEVEDIFDNSKPGERAAPYHWANELHLQTRDEAIRTQLLFQASEPYSRQKMAETERLLRGRRYLYDAWIEPDCYHPDENTVDVQVRVRDVWSLNPGIHFSRKGGTTITGTLQTLAVGNTSLPFMLASSPFPRCLTATPRIFSKPFASFTISP